MYGKAARSPAWRRSGLVGGMEEGSSLTGTEVLRRDSIPLGVEEKGCGTRPARTKVGSVGRSDGAVWTKVGLVGVMGE